MQVTINATAFFNREIFMYALGDIKLKNPIPMRKAAHIIGFLVAWCLPLVFVFGLHLNVFYIMFLLVPPIVLGNLATKQIFGGKGLLDFASTVTAFIGEPKGWTDWNNNHMRQERYTISNEIWISRRRELQLLADVIEGKARLIEETPDAAIREDKTARAAV